MAPALEFDTSKHDHVVVLGLIDEDTGDMTFSFTVPNDLSAVTLKIETSTDLSTWTERAMTLTASDGSTDTWSTTVRLGGRAFARLQVDTYTP